MLMAKKKIFGHTLKSIQLLASNISVSRNISHCIEITQGTIIWKWLCKVQAKTLSEHGTPSLETRYYVFVS